MGRAEENSFLSQQLNGFKLHARPITQMTHFFLRLVELSSILHIA